MVTMKIGGLEATLLNLRGSSKDLRNAAGPAFNAGGEALKKVVQKRIGLRDHTLADLARLDHPYARRHGTIQIHRRKPWQVHRQDGEMYHALEGYPLTLANQHGYEITFDYARAPHAEDVILGTQVMLPRDVLWETARDDYTRKRMMRAIVRTLGKELRAQIGVRFRSSTPAGGAGGNTLIR